MIIAFKKQMWFNKILIFLLIIKMRSMDTEQNCIQNQFNGFRLRIRLTGQTLKVMMISRESGKKYQSDLAYQAQSDNFKFSFGSMQQAFQHIKDELTAKSRMIKIDSEGRLQIGINQRQKVAYLTLEIQQVELQQSAWLIQFVNFVENDVNDLKTNIDQIKKILDEQQQESMLKIKQWVRRQINDLKQQLSGAINIKSDFSGTDGKAASLRQPIKQFAEMENKSQFNRLIAQVKAQFEDLLSRQSRKSEDKLKEANTRIQDLKRQLKQLEKNSEVKLPRHTEFGGNSEQYLRSLGQIAQVQTLLKSTLQEQARKFKIAENLLNYKFPKMMDCKLIQLTADTNYFKFGFFQTVYFKMINDRMFQKVDNIRNRQAVSKEQLPRKGKYCFQVMFHYSGNIQPKYVHAMVGIITQDLKKSEDSFNSEQCVSYTLGGGYIWQNGQSRKFGTAMYSRTGLVTVVIDADQRSIGWYFNHQFQASTIINQIIMSKKIYAFVDVVNQGTILQFKG